MDEQFDTKERKRAFDEIFKETIVPFFKTYGFSRHTKTAKRLYKQLDNHLSVWVFFEYKTFGDGFYTINIAYFDDEVGDIYDDMYLAMATVKTPKINGSNRAQLRAAAKNWLTKMESQVMPFIENHSTHHDIFHSNYFIVPPRNEKILKRKAIS